MWSTDRVHPDLRGSSLQLGISRTDPFSCGDLTPCVDHISRCFRSTLTEFELVKQNTRISLFDSVFTRTRNQRRDGDRGTVTIAGGSAKNVLSNDVQHGYTCFRFGLVINAETTSKKRPLFLHQPNISTIVEDISRAFVFRHRKP